MKLPLLFNPKSGLRKKDPEALLRALPSEARARVEPIPIAPFVDFAPYIAQAERAGGPLLIWGGDGTIHHAAKALLEAGCPVPLAAIPGGSGNGLVRGLRTPLEPAGAVQRLLEGREIALDVGLLDGAPFFNLCGAGFEAAVAHAFEAGAGRGLSGYVRTCLGLYLHHPTAALTWEAEFPPPTAPLSKGGRLKSAWRGPEPPLPAAAWSLCFAVLPQYGSGLWIAPQADPCDGNLNWVRLSRPGILDTITGLPALFREGGRTHLRQEGRILRASVQLDQAMPWHMDGEPVQARDRAELSTRPGALRMQVTGACPW